LSHQVWTWLSFWESHPENKVRNIYNHRIWGGGAGRFQDFGGLWTGEGGNHIPPARRLRKETILLLLTLRPSKLPCNLGTIFVEPSSHKLFRPPFRPKKDHRVKADLHICIIRKRGHIYIEGLLENYCYRKEVMQKLLEYHPQEGILLLLLLPSPLPENNSSCKPVNTSL
jgi:hypothetical protein